MIDVYKREPVCSCFICYFSLLLFVSEMRNLGLKGACGNVGRTLNYSLKFAQTPKNRRPGRLTAPPEDPTRSLANYQLAAPVRSICVMRGGVAFDEHVRITFAKG